MIEAQSITGSAKAVLEFAREAAHPQNGVPKIDLSILTFDRSEGENNLTRVIQELGIPHDVVVERGRFDMRIIRQLRSAAAKRKIDLIWTNSVKSHFVVRVSGINRAIRWVAFHHGYTATDLKMKAYNQLDRWSLPAADRVLTSSASFVPSLEKKNVRRDHIRVQHMPVRPHVEVSEAEKAKLRESLNIDAGSRVLLSVGRLSQEKGQLDLIRAFAKIRELTGDASLRVVLVGDGPERSRIESMCRSLRVTEAVTLTGHQHEINAYYGIASVFVLPSLSEGSPNVLLEAMSGGVPVVATAVGGIPEIVTDGADAILVNRGDPLALASAVTRALDDVQLRDRLISSARGIVQRHTPKKYFESIASVFQQAHANEI